MEILPWHTSFVLTLEVTLFFTSWTVFWQLVSAISAIVFAVAE